MATRNERVRRTPYLVAAILTIISLAVMGAFSTFTSSDTRSHTVSTGTVSILIDDSTFQGKVADPVVNMAAGDNRQRAFVINNTSSLPLSELSVTVAATAGHETDPLIVHTDGLEAAVQVCSLPYTETAGQTIGIVTPVSTFACSGTETSATYHKVVSSTAVNVITHDTVIDGIQNAGADEYIKVTLRLAQAAPNALQDETTSVTYTVNATQRPGQVIDGDGVGESIEIPGPPQNISVSTPGSPGGTAIVFGELPANAVGEQVDKYEVTISEVSGPTTGPRGPDEVLPVYDLDDPPFGYLFANYTGLMAFANDPPATYSVVVRAHNAAGWGPYSDPVEFTPEWTICC